MVKIGNIELDEADVLWASQQAEAIVEEELQEFFDGEDWSDKDASEWTFSHIGWDHYDGSIEIYLKSNAKYDEDKLTKLLEGFGFGQGWLNFTDKTEIHFSAGLFGRRSTKGHSTWTDETHIIKIRKRLKAALLSDEIFPTIL